MIEYRLQCTETDRIWPRTYDNERAAVCAQGQWNRTAVRLQNGQFVGGHPPTRAVECEVKVKRVVREPVE